MTNENIVSGRIKSFEIREIEKDGNVSFSVHVKVKTNDGVNRIIFNKANKLENISFVVIGEAAISIKDISSRGWENLKYSVEDLIGQRFQFYCEEVLLQ